MKLQDVLIRLALVGIAFVLLVMLWNTGQTINAEYARVVG